MTGKFWTEEQTDALRKAWNNRRADITTLDFARDYASVSERSIASVTQKLKTMPEYGIPTSNRTTWNNPPRVEGDAFIIGDTQIPFHHAEFIERCLELCKRWGIKTMILGGDALDVESLSSFTPDFENDKRRVIDSRSAEALVKFADTLKSRKREELLDIIGDAERENGVGGEIKESRAVLKALEEHFDRLIWIMGNHEKRVLKALEKILPVDTLATLFGADSPKWEVSPYYWCVLVSGGVEWQIEHPINTGKGSSKKLAPKFGKNIVMFHNHHYSITTDPSGEFYAIEPGMGMDESRMPYAMQRHNAADMHMVGALIVRHGKPTPLNKWTDWDMLK